MSRISIAQPQLLHIKGNGTLSYGATQLWYSVFWRRRAGCGPTCASNLLWYLAATCPEKYRCLYDGDCRNRHEMIFLMNKVWHYVTPGMRGLNKSSMFTDGVTLFGKDRGVNISCRVLEVSADSSLRPSQDQVLEFLTAAFEDDLPVAFLNLSNGQVKNLDNWHWVTLVSTDENLQAEMYDDSGCELVDVALWLETTTGGGAFVAIE